MENGKDFKLEQCADPLDISKREMTLSSMFYNERKGKLPYDKYCSVCYGTQGNGDGFNACNIDPRPKDLTEAEYLATLSNYWLSEVVSQGGRGVKRSVLMPSYERC